MRRCMDCLGDATHSLRWYRTRGGYWSAYRVHNQTALHLYCHWHATVRATQRNARGIRSPMEHLHQILRRQEGTDA